MNKCVDCDGTGLIGTEIAGGTKVCDQCGGTGTIREGAAPVEAPEVPAEETAPGDGDADPVTEPEQPEAKKGFIGTLLG